MGVAPSDAGRGSFQPDQDNKELTVLYITDLSVVCVSFQCLTAGTEKPIKDSNAD